MNEEGQPFTANDLHSKQDAVIRHHAYPGSFHTDLINSMQDGFSLVDSEGLSLDVNPSLCRITGFSREELIGKGPPHPYWPPEEYSNIHKALEETLNGNGSTFELTFMRKNGERFPAIISSFTIAPEQGPPTLYAATVKDITKRKQVENAMLNWSQTLEGQVAARTAELEQTKNRYRQLVDATFEGIVVSKNGIIIDANHQFTEMLKYDLPAVIGMTVLDFVAPESRAVVVRHIVDGLEGPYEFTAIRKDGTTLPMEAHGRIMDLKGKEMRVTALRDLSAAKSAAALLAGQKSELDQALRLALVSEISAGIVHQIVQPLSAIGGHVSALSARNQSGHLTRDEHKEILDEMAALVAQMRDTVIHLRALANPEQPKRQPTDFNAMVTEAVKLAQATAGAGRFEVVTRMDHSLPLFPVDKIQMCQVVGNLLRNAMDASEDLQPERRIIYIFTRAMENQTLELLVRDSGTGILPECESRLFCPFFSTKPDGLGIGLKLSRTIVEAHGGSLDGHNNPDGIGATFRVTLPLISADNHTKV